ncbi:MFS transporter [Brachybacterium hainanense]|uniref:MFS transporter n=1 Tax=Brachybacterium hainanense TaxID=1541174 RepID=A0ABV6RAN1_9MICO
MTSTATPHRRLLFACTAFALFTLIVGTNIPSPFYAVYAARLGFSPLVLTAVFAAYAGALIPTLLLAGSLAESLGYRWVVLAGLALALCASLLLTGAGSAGELLLARALQGMAVGISSGALTAALTRTTPAGRTELAALIASSATTAGGGLGPMLAGLWATVLPGPMVTSYLLEAGALLLAGAGLAALPAGLGRSGARWRPRLPRIPPQRRVFMAACVVSFLGWAVTAVFLSVVPSYVSALTGSDSLLVAGLSSGLVLVIAALMQPLAARLPAPMLQGGGLLALAAGVLILLISGLLSSLAGVLLAAVMAGCGQGMGFLGAMRESARVSVPGTEAATASAFFISAYLGVGVPTIGVGLLATLIGTVPAVEVFAAVVLLAAIAAIPGTRSAGGVAHR